MQSAIAETAIKEFESLSEFLPNLQDTDGLANVLSENISSSDTQTRVGKMFFK